MSSEDNMGCVPQLIQDAQEALSRLHRTQLLPDWFIYGKAFMVLRVDAMRIAKTNEPKGRKYSTAMATLLKEAGLDSVHKTTRSRLKDVMENREAIEAWLTTVPQDKRLKLNHPEPVLSAWKRATTPPTTKEPKTTKPELVAGSPEAIGQQLEGLALDADQVRAMLAHAPKLRETIQQCIRSIWERQQRTKRKNARLAKKAKKAAKVKKKETVPAPVQAPKLDTGALAKGLALKPTAGNDVPTDESAATMSAKLEALAEVSTEAVAA
jgi:hypothetical protein